MYEDYNSSVELISNVMSWRVVKHMRCNFPEIKGFDYVLPQESWKRLKQSKR